MKRLFYSVRENPIHKSHSHPHPIIKPINSMLIARLPKWVKWSLILNLSSIINKFEVSFRDYPYPYHPPNSQEFKDKDAGMSIMSDLVSCGKGPFVPFRNEILNPFPYPSITKNWNNFPRSHGEQKIVPFGIPLPSENRQIQPTRERMIPTNKNRGNPPF